MAGEPARRFVLRALAVWAVVGTSLGNDYPLYVRAADRAGHTYFPVDLMQELEAALVPLAVDVVANRAAAVKDGQVEEIDDGAVEAAGADRAKAFGFGARVECGAEERFVSVDIAETTKEGLIEKKGFDEAAAGGEAGEEVVLGE